MQLAAWEIWSLILTGRKMRWTISLDGVVNQNGCSHWKSVSKSNSCPQESVYYNVLIAIHLRKPNQRLICRSVENVDSLPGTPKQKIGLWESQKPFFKDYVDFLPGPRYYTGAFFSKNRKQTPPWPLNNLAHPFCPKPEPAESSQEAKSTPDLQVCGKCWFSSWAPVLYRGIPLEEQKANTPMTPQQPSSSLLPKPRTSRIITSEIPK